MEYKEAIEYIHSTLRFGSRPGLQAITCLLKLLGNPHKELKFVHIAGTNGKGSTAAMISSILQQAGYKTGLFISPYLEKFTERIQINYEHIPEEQVGKLTGLLKEKIHIMLYEGMQHPTEFEIVTALGFLYFARQGVDIVVLETGMGGRLDATNAVDSLVSVITSVSMDHSNVLGDTVEKIAKEKAGIIKNNGVVISSLQVLQAAKVIEDSAKDRSARLIMLNQDTVKLKKYDLTGQVFDYRLNQRKIHDLRIGLLGGHQLMNAALAITAADTLQHSFGLNITDKSIENGLKKAVWPGRLEIVSNNPMIIIDGAHNADAFEKLGQFIDKNLGDKTIVIVIGMLNDKDVKDSIEKIIPYSNRFITTTPDNPRAMKAGEVSEIIRLYGKNSTAVKSIEQAVKHALQTACKDEVVLFCGSLYLIGKVRRIIRALKGE